MTAQERSGGLNKDVAALLIQHHLSHVIPNSMQALHALSHPEMLNANWASSVMSSLHMHIQLSISSVAECHPTMLKHLSSTLL